MANPKGQAKEIAEKPVGSDKTQAPSKVGTEAVNSAEYANLGKNEYSLLPGLNVQMEQKGWLPSLSVSMDTQKMVDAAGQGIQDAGKAVEGQLNQLQGGVDSFLHGVQEQVSQQVGESGKQLRRGVAEIGSMLDDLAAPLFHQGSDGNKPQADMPHSELKVIQDLKDKSMNSFNCHYLAKTFIEGGPPNESRAAARNEQVTPKYLNEHGYQEVTKGEAKPGDIILVEDTGSPSKYYNHVAIASKVVDGQISETLQKAHPDGPVLTLNGPQFAGQYMTDEKDHNRFKMHVYRNPAKEGRLE